MKPIFPPRPKTRIHPNLLPQYEKRDGWLIQRKFNGARNLIFVDGSHVQLFGRYGEPHKRFQLTPSLKKQILSLSLPSGKTWLDGELLDAKTTDPRYKGKIVLYDVLQAGRYLFGVSQTDRLDKLEEICKNASNHESGHGIALQVTDDIWMAETFESDFVGRFEDFLDCDEIEGVVLRKKKAKLDNLGKREYEVSWQIRCRKPHANYTF